MPDGFGLRVGSLAGLVVVAAALTAGCGGKSPPSDAAVEHPPANCGGAVDVTGSSPQGPFTATSLYAEVSIKSPACSQGLQFIVGDRASGSAFAFYLRIDDRTVVPLGETLAIVDFSGAHDTDTGLFQATTTATIDVTAADLPPFATCEQALGDPVNLGSGNIAMTIAMSQDGFDLTGTLSTPYCSCRACPDTI